MDAHKYLSQGRYMQKIKLDFTGMSQEDLRNYQELFVSTIGKLKQGLFNAEAAIGLQNSITLLSDFHLQVSTHLREIRNKLAEIGIATEVLNEEA